MYLKCSPCAAVLLVLVSLTVWISEITFLKPAFAQNCFLLQDLTETLQNNSFSGDPSTSPRVTLCAGPSDSIEREVTVQTARPPFHEGTPTPAMAEKGNNYCGNYAMSVIFASLGIDPDFNRIMKDMNPCSIYTAPVHFVEYARKRGAPARAKNNASREDLIFQLDRGRACAVLLNSGEKISNVHWVAVTGYRINNNRYEWRIMDSYWGAGERTGYIWLSDEEFMKRWSNLLAGSVFQETVAYRNYAVFFDGNSGIASEFQTATEDAVLGMINDAAAGWKNRSIGQLSSAAIKGTGAILSAPASLTGRAVDSGGRTLIEWGQNLENSSWRILQGTGYLLNYTGHGISTGGNILDGAARSIAWVSNKISGWFK